MNDNWRLGGMVLGSRLGLAFERGSDLHLFRLCRLRTGHCIRFSSGHRLIILSTYLFMGAGKVRCSFIMGSGSFWAD